MQDTILKICKQIHEKLPTKRIAITRFVGKYEYGQIYVGELDRDVKREPCAYMFAKRNFCVVYSQDPTKDQETARKDFETVCQTLEDEAPFFYEPHWYKTFFDVFETTLILEFQVYERYERKQDGTVMADLETSYPHVIYDGDIPEPPGPGPEPPGPGPEPPGPSPTPDFSEQGMTGLIRVWGDEVDTGTEFGEYSFGGMVDNDLTTASLFAEPMSDLIFELPGLMTIRR